MALTNQVLMPGADYQAICNKVRELTGGTAPLKSGDIVTALSGVLPGGGGEQPQLLAPTISVTEDLLTITPNPANGGFVSGWRGYAAVGDGDFTLFGTLPADTLTLDLTQQGLAAAAYRFKAAAIGNNFIESAASNIVAYTNVFYAVTKTLSNCSINYAGETVRAGSAFAATLTPAAGYTMSGATVTVTMGGEDITATAYSNGAISIAQVTGDIVITASAVLIIIPVDKGDLITINGREYRVLNIVGSVAEVLSMADDGYVNFGSNNTYANSNLDTALNTTFYNALPSNIQAAIIEKNIIQYAYVLNDESSMGTHASYADYLTKKQKANVGIRKVYALDIEDIETYFNGTFSTDDLRMFFWNTTSPPSSSASLWLRSARDGYANHAWIMDKSDGKIMVITSTNINRDLRPAFQIDLSKIDWEKVEQ